MVERVYAEVLDGEPSSLRVGAFVHDDDFFSQVKEQASRRIGTAYWLGVQQETRNKDPYATLHCRLGLVPFDLVFHFEHDDFGRKQSAALLAGALAPTMLVEMFLDFVAGTGAYRARLDLSAVTPVDTGRVAVAVAAVL